MSWVFLNPSDADASRRHFATLDRMDAWWQEFTAERAALQSQLTTQPQKLEWMQGRLAGIHPDLSHQARKTADGYELVVHSLGFPAVQPLLQSLIERAPELSEWKFLANFPALPATESEVWLPFHWGAATQLLAAKVERTADHLLRVTFLAPQRPQEDLGTLEDEASFVARAYLGEALCNSWIDPLLDVVDELPDAVALPDMLPAALDQIESIRAILPAEPCFLIPAGEPTLFENERDATGGFRRWRDATTGSTWRPDVLLATQSEAPFASERFSRCGERFAYVQIDREAALQDSSFTSREDLEGFLDRALRQSELGAVIGGQTGVLCEYVDVALTDVQRAVKVLQMVLKWGKLPNRAWLRFHDAEWADEYLGLRPDSPVPDDLLEQRKRAWLDG